MKEKRYDRDKEIKKEYRALKKLFQGIPENKFALIDPLLHNQAFMKIILDELQEAIKAEGAVEEYQNGANQKGRKASANLQAYNNTVKQFNAINKRLAEMLPEEKKLSKLEMLKNA